MHSLKSKTPVAEALLSMREMTKHSFHALPILKGNSLVNSELADHYETLLGENLLASELSITGHYFDSFFFPKAAILESENLAARAFGADGTLYVTTGTTTSNHIAINALFDQGPVLIDKNCHQSLHFMFHSLNAKIDYLQPEFQCEKSGRSAWRMDSFLDIVCKAEQAGRPYALIVLTAQSYEGVIYDIPKILRALLEAGVSTRRFLIDEAWGAANYFNPELRAVSAMNIDTLMLQYPELEVVCTQSAHKSISALRQASMIHFRGGKELRERLHIAKFRLHSTSPSYPILASLDLAQAQMASEGSQRVAQAIALAEGFKATLQAGTNWSSYQLCPMPDLGDMSVYIKQDPCKLSINIESLCMAACDVQAYLFREHGVYVNRFTHHCILLNFHIGINESAVTAMLTGLAELQQQQLTKIQKKTHSGFFVIPYPPGVPLLVPGELITETIRAKIESIRNSGIALLEI